MKICAAQTKSIKGNIPANINNHKKLIDLAVANGAGLIIFPELSLTGYEPTLAKDLATTPHDPRLDEFQTISDARKITIGVGIPTRDDLGIHITLVLFQPSKQRQAYSKKYLHADEEPFFTSGRNFNPLKVEDIDIALAICYEISIPEHADNAFQSGAGIYIASVAKSVKGIDKAIRTLSDTAAKYSATVLMSNCTGQCDGEEGAGRSSAWNSQGELVGQLNDVDEGILIVDTDSGMAMIRVL